MSITEQRVLRISFSIQGALRKDVDDRLINFRSLVLLCSVPNNEKEFMTEVALVSIFEDPKDS